MLHALLKGNYFPWVQEQISAHLIKGSPLTLSLPSAFRDLGSGSSLSFSRLFYDEHWSKHRVITCLDWSPQVWPETLCPSLNTFLPATMKLIYSFASVFQEEEIISDFLMISCIFVFILIYLLGPQHPTLLLFSNFYPSVSWIAGCLL